MKTLAKKVIKANLDLTIGYRLDRRGKTL